jgi:hypothetical protein
MKQPAVLLLMFFVLLGQFPAFLRAMKNRQTARAWFLGFAIALLAGCWLSLWL